MNKKPLLRRAFITGFIIAILCFTMFVVFTNEVSANVGPVIDSVSPITATRLQTIIIRGRGFGDTQPVTMTLWDGSINTVGGGKNMSGEEGTPVIQVNNYARNTWGSGVQDSPETGCCSIGIFLEKWSDTEIVLGGFGSALSTNGYGEWTIEPGDPMRIVIITPNGIATYDTTVVSNGIEPAPNQTPPIISSVSPISPTRLQTIYITGSGFGIVPPQMISVGDGSVNTADCGGTPAIQIRDNAVWGGWTAGREGNAIGIIILSWTDTQIVLGGFGSALGTNGEIAWSIMSGDPIDVAIKTDAGMALFSTVVTGSPTRVNQTFTGQAPVITSVSQITTSLRQTIHIYGSGFGDVQPKTESLGDGSINTVGGGNTPIIQVHDDGWRGWQAGVRDSPQSGACAIGIILEKWSDTEIILGGFGSALSLDGNGKWNLMAGDPIRIVIWTSGGIATYKTTAVEDSDTPPKLDLPTPVLAVYCKSSTTLSNFRVEISGSLTHNGTGLQCVPVLFSYSVDGGNSWNQLTLVNTDNNGDFSAVWLPAVTGNFLLKAEYLGDALYSKASTVVNFAVSASGEQNVFSVTSNSTISALVFNSTSKELGFTVSGQSGTMGYVNVYVPKALISDASNLKVFLDGNAISFNAESSADSWLVSFTYPHSTHEVTMKMNSASSTTVNQNQLEQWFPYVIITVLIVIIAFLLISIKRKTTSHN
jgi:hypothetical protein